MAQGTRGRFALLGAGMLFCMGLVGCMDSDPKPLGKSGQSKAPTPGLMGSTVKPGQTPLGTGVQPSWNQPVSRTPPNNDFKSSAGSASTISGPAVTGLQGPGAFPAIAPPGQNYVNYTSPYDPAPAARTPPPPPYNPPTLGYEVPTPPSPPPLSGGTAYPVPPATPPGAIQP